jgi:pSer/pThr/pTyr-binding forkhead associated (FHA) protein
LKDIPTFASKRRRVLSEHAAWHFPRTIDSAVSARHAAIQVKANEHFPQFNEYYLADLNSTNGTYINDLRINGSQRLHHNDEVRIAWNKFKFVDDHEAALERTAHIVSSN